MTDYLLVVALVGLAFGLGADGPLMQLIDAIAAHHQRFTWAIAQP